MIETVITFIGVMGCFALGYWVGQWDGYTKGFRSGSDETLAWMQHRQKVIQAMGRKPGKPPELAGLLSQLG